MMSALLFHIDVHSFEVKISKEAYFEMASIYSKIIHIFFI